MAPPASDRHYSTLQLLARSVTPTAVEALACFCFGICILGLHLLFLSINIGTSLPSFFDGHWAQGYTNVVVQPLNDLLNNQDFNNTLVVVLWGVVGLCTYFLLEYIHHLYRTWRQAQHNIQFTGQAIVQHPTWGNFITTVIWRMAILMIAMAFLIAIQPVVQHLLADDPRLVLGNLSLTTGILKLITSLVAWTLIAHSIVVLLRLFTMRTRLSGEVLY